MRRDPLRLGKWSASSGSLTRGPTASFSAYSKVNLALLLINNLLKNYSGFRRSNVYRFSVFTIQCVPHTADMLPGLATAYGLDAYVVGYCH